MLAVPRQPIVQSIADEVASTCFVGSHPVQEVIAAVLSSPMRASSKRKSSSSLPDDRTPQETTSKAIDSGVAWPSVISNACSRSDQLWRRPSTCHICCVCMCIGHSQELAGTYRDRWNDTTRIAAGSTDLWRQIIAENQGPVLHAAKNFATIWKQIIEAIEAQILTN